MDKKLWEEVPGKTLPKVKGDYITNFGRLYFDGQAFLMPGHKNRTPTIVEWWLTPYTS